MLNPRDCAVIWDVDGTLVDTAELHFQSWVQLARELNKPFTRADLASRVRSVLDAEAMVAS